MQYANGDGHQAGEGLVRDREPRLRFREDDYTDQMPFTGRKAELGKVVLAVRTRPLMRMLCPTCVGAPNMSCWVLQLQQRCKQPLASHSKLLTVEGGSRTGRYRCTQFTSSVVSSHGWTQLRADLLQANHALGGSFAGRCRNLALLGLRNLFLAVRTSATLADCPFPICDTK